MKNTIIAILLLSCIIPIGCATTVVADSGIAPTLANVAASVEEYKAVPPPYQLMFKIDPETRHLIIRGSDGVEADVDEFVSIMGRIKAKLMKGKAEKE